MRFIKSPATGMISVKVKTPFGPRKIPLNTGNMKEAKKLAARADLHEIEANRLRRDVLQLMATGKRAMKCGDAVNEWLEEMKRAGFGTVTLYDYRLRVSKFLTEMKLGDARVSAVELDHIGKFINHEKAGKASTRQAMLSTIRTWLDFCVRKRWIDDNPARSIRNLNYAKMTHEQKDVDHKVPFTDDELRHLMNHIGEQIACCRHILAGNRQPWRFQCHDIIRQKLRWLEFWKVAVPIAQHTGLRLGDVAGLEWATMRDPNVIAVWTEKRDRRVELPMSDDLRAAIAGISKTDEVYCFPEQRRIHIDHRSRCKLPKQFGRLLACAKIKGKSFHSLRATFAVNIVRRLVAVGHSEDHAKVVARDLLGHTLVKTTEVYLKRAHEAGTNYRASTPPPASDSGGA